MRPYGVRDADDIYDLTTRGVQVLFDEGCDLVILACNTASAAALRRMQEGWVPDGQAGTGRLRAADRGADRAQGGAIIPRRRPVAVGNRSRSSPPPPTPPPPATVSSRAFPARIWRFAP